LEESSAPLQSNKSKKSDLSEFNHSILVAPCYRRGGVVWKGEWIPRSRRGEGGRVSGSPTPGGREGEWIPTPRGGRGRGSLSWQEDNQGRISPLLSPT